LHVPFPRAAAGFVAREAAPASDTEQLRLDALMEPSRHKNCSPTQRSMPPFFPEQGVFAAAAATEISIIATSINKRIVVS